MNKTDDSTTIADVISNVFRRIAINKIKDTEPSDKSTPEIDEIEKSILHSSENSQDIVYAPEHKKLINEKKRNSLIKKHGNDPNKRLNLCGFPNRDRDFMMTYDYQSFIPGVDFKNNSWDWQFLVGSEGTGKTTVACRQAWEWMKKDVIREVSFISMCELIEKMKRNSIKGDEEPDIPILKPFVIIDDFNKIYYTDWQMLQVFRIVDFLYRSDKKVIFTSNENFKEIIKTSDYNGHIKNAIDRIKGRTHGAVIGMYVNSYRAKK